MKTSNKFMLFVAIGFFVVLVAVILLVRSALWHEAHFGIWSGGAFSNRIERNYLRFAERTEPMISATSIVGSGKVVTRTYALRDARFDVVNVVIPCHVEVKVADKTPQGRGVAISANENLLPYINVQVKNGVLNIAPNKDNVNFRFNDGITVVVTSDRLQAIEAKCASKIVAQNIHGDEFTLFARGASDVVLQGKVQRLVLNLNGAANVDASQLLAGQANIVIRGAGVATVLAEQVLHINIAGTGVVNYYGNPKDMTRMIRGFGMVRYLGAISDADFAKAK